MEDEALRFLYLTALLLFLLPLVLRSGRWNARLAVAALAVFGAAVVLALVYTVIWFVG